MAYQLDSRPGLARIAKLTEEKMKIVLSVFLFSAMLLGQATPSSNQPSQSSSPQASPAAAGPRGEMSPNREMREERRQQMMQQHQQAMAEMKADMEKMRRMVLMMRSEALKVQDVSTRDAMQTNADLWGALLDHMQKHMTQMEQMPHPGMGMGMRPGAQPPEEKPKQ